VGTIRNLKNCKSWDDLFCKDCPNLVQKRDSIGFYCRLNPPQYVGDDRKKIPAFLFPTINFPKEYWCYYGRRIMSGNDI
jgi:hypothetical protein